MSLVRWFRKNNTKIMAVVVIVLMFGFVGGSYLSYLGRRRSPLHRTVALFLDNRKITNYDIHNAQSELELLQSIRADDLLRAQDLPAIFLAELLFAGQRTSPELIRYVRSTIARNLYPISNQQLAAIYERPMPPSIYWILLKEEAKRLGKRPGELGKERRKTLNELSPELRKELLNFFEKYQYEIVKEALVDDYDIEHFYVVVVSIDENLQICRYYIVSAEKALNKLLEGGVKQGKRGTIYIGRVVLQRKGGDQRDKWDDSVACQLQFKIRPSDLIINEEPIYEESYEYQKRYLSLNKWL